MTPSESRRTFVEDDETDEMRAFVMERWTRRAQDLGIAPPADLSSSCKFGSLFVRTILGGEIRGNWNHVHCRLADGRILDLSRRARDVESIRSLGVDPYQHHRAFVRSRDFRDSLASCRPRVESWVEEWGGRRPLP